MTPEQEVLNGYLLSEEEMDQIAQTTAAIRDTLDEIGLMFDQPELDHDALKEKLEHAQTLLALLVPNITGEDMEVDASELARLADMAERGPHGAN